MISIKPSSEALFNYAYPRFAATPILQKDLQLLRALIVVDGRDLRVHSSLTGQASFDASEAAAVSTEFSEAIAFGGHTVAAVVTSIFGRSNIRHSDDLFSLFVVHTTSAIDQALNLNGTPPWVPSVKDIGDAIVSGLSQRHYLH